MVRTMEHAKVQVWMQRDSVCAQGLYRACALRSRIPLQAMRNPCELLGLRRIHGA